MFKINLASFEGAKEFDFTLTKRDLVFDKGVEIKDELLVSVVLTKDTDKSIIAQADIKGKLAVECSRCLKEFETPVESQYVAIYREKDAFSQDDKDSDNIPYEDNEIDLYDFLRQSLFLELPMKPLCGEDCRGFCSVCGRDLNEGECGCDRKIKLNPFEKLEGINLKHKKG
ncbi:MAG TPA: DUF177 domain-containing protein [bacterium]|nr:DUF177 domain-containing protein [bacterium]